MRFESSVMVLLVVNTTLKFAVAPTPLAKSTRYSDPKSLSGFRHEWGSANKDVTEAAWRSLESKYPEEDRNSHKELFYHILVSHHGYLRPDLPDQPNWESAALDPLRLDANLILLSYFV